jgi:hypothetical protein
MQIEVSLSAKTLEKRLFTEHQFNKAGTLERLYIHLIDPGRFKLKRDEEDELIRIKASWEIVRDELSRRVAIDRIREELGLSVTAAAHLYWQATELYGRMFNANPDPAHTKAVLREKMILLGRQAEDNEDYEEARKCYEFVAKMDGVERPSEDAAGPRFTPKETPMVVFSSNPKALELTSGEEE